MTPAGDGSHGELDPDTPTRERTLTLSKGEEA